MSVAPCPASADSENLTRARARAPPLTPTPAQVVPPHPHPHTPSPPPAPPREGERGDPNDPAAFCHPMESRPTFGARCVGIRAGREQHADDLDVAFNARTAEGCPAAAVRRCIHIRSSSEQRAHDLNVTPT